MTTPTQVLSDEQIFDHLKHVRPDAVRLPRGFRDFARAIEAAVLASIAPTVDAKDERAAFDTWMRDCEGYPYAGHYANLMWKAWQARSALAQPSAAKNAPVVPAQSEPVAWRHKWTNDASNAWQYESSGPQTDKLRIGMPGILNPDSARAQWGPLYAHAPAQTADVQSLRRIASELRAYNPAADEYKGRHIHKVWAREIDAALSQSTEGK